MSKRKHNILTIKQKLDIVQKLQEGEKSNKLAAEYNIGLSTVSDIKRNKEKLLKYWSSMAGSIVGIDQRHTMKESPFAILDKSLLHWFNQERSVGNPVTGTMIAQRAKELFITLGMEGTFDASSGWLCRFKDRYGIRPSGKSLDCKGRKLDSDDNKEFDLTASIDESEEINNLNSEEIINKDNNETVSKTSQTPQIQDVENTCRTEIEEAGEGEQATKDMEISRNEGTNIEFEVEMNEEIEEDTCICKNLNPIVKMLQSVSEKLVANSLNDGFDDFAKYISSLLRQLPKKHALRLKRKLVDDIIDVSLAHERGELDSLEKQKSNEDEPLIKEKITRKSISYTCDKSCSTDDLEASQTISSSSLAKAPNPDQIAKSDCPVIIRKCKSIKKVTSTSDSVLLAVTLPSRNSQLVGSPPPLVPIRSTSSTGRKRKQNADWRRNKRVSKAIPELFSKQPTTVVIEGNPNNSSRMISEGRVTGFDIQEGKDLSVMKHNEEESINFISANEVKEEPLDDDIPGEVYICEICLTQYLTRDSLIQHFQQDHPGCDPGF